MHPQAEHEVKFWSIFVVGGGITSVRADVILAVLGFRFRRQLKKRKFWLRLCRTQLLLLPYSIATPQ